MRTEVEQWLTDSRQKAVEGTLKPADVDRLVDLLRQPTQQILYLYSKSTNMRSALASWMLYDASQPQEPTLPSAEPPYASVLAAIADGWRVVQFPDPTRYSYQDVDNDYLGYEFILEKMV